MSKFNESPLVRLFGPFVLMATLLTLPLQPTSRLHAEEPSHLGDMSKETEQGEEGKQSSRPIVIVHGAWGGAHQWKPVARMLQAAHGGPIHRVTLTGQGERTHLASPDVNLTTHIQDVLNVISFEELDSIVLIGHSYGGAVISGVADAVPEKISQLVYLDANVLKDGESFLTLMPKKLQKYTQRASEAGDGWRIPIEWENKTRDVPHQLATLTQPISLKNEKRMDIPTHYWLFADGKPAADDVRFVFYERAKAWKWQTQVFAWHHNPHTDLRDELVTALLKVVEK